MAKVGVFFGCSSLALALALSWCGVVVALALREVLKKGKGEVAMAKAGCFFGCLSLLLSFSLCGVCVALSLREV